MNSLEYCERVQALKDDAWARQPGLDDGFPLAMRRYQLAEARCLRAAAEREVVEHVTQLRSLGASWSEVGHELGISKQAAQKRYGVKSAVTKWLGGATEPTLM